MRNHDLLVDQFAVAELRLSLKNCKSFISYEFKCKKNIDACELLCELRRENSNHKVKHRLEKYLSTFCPRMAEEKNVRNW